MTGHKLPRDRESVRRRDARISELYRNGSSSNEIAKALGMNPKGVLASLHRNGVEVRPAASVRTPEYAAKNEEVRRLREEGYTVLQISATLGLTVDSVKHRLRTMGLTADRPGRPPTNDEFFRDRR